MQPSSTLRRHPSHERLERELAVGEVLLEQGQAERALACFEEILRLQPGLSRALDLHRRALERTLSPGI